MSLKLTAASFLNGVRQSGLVELDRLEALLRELQHTGVDTSDSRLLADEFVRRDALTNWQAEKLLQGRHKGFILGRYRLLSLLGAGEMSAVFLAKHVMMDRQCAIKVLPGNKVHDTSYLARFYREARAVASLNHPNIVRAFDVDKQLDGGAELHYLVMEYVDGRNLEKLVTAQGRLSVTDAVDYMRQAASGLGHAHQAGLVHRDVKPQNLLVDAQGQLKLLDLGLARFFKGDANEESLTIKHDEKVLGTADYLAPEQAVDSHNVDARADIYSLGCTLYFALAGHPPFTEGTLVQRLLAHQTRKPTPITVVRPETPTAVAAILEKMMAKKAADRYQSMAEVCEALSRWLIDEAGEEWKRANVQLVAMYAPLDQTVLTASKRAAPVASTPAKDPQRAVAKSPATPSLEEQIATELGINVSAELSHVPKARAASPVERSKSATSTSVKPRTAAKAAVTPRPVSKPSRPAAPVLSSQQPETPQPMPAVEENVDLAQKRRPFPWLLVGSVAVALALLSCFVWVLMHEFRGGTETAAPAATDDIQNSLTNLAPRDLR